MSTSTKTPRLLAAAKEFNIGKGTLIEFLSNKNFAVTDSPAFKLTEEMYDALTAEFAQDKAAKRRSDEIALPKSSGERKRDVEQPARKADAVAQPQQPAATKPAAPEVKPVATPTAPPVAATPKPITEEEHQSPVKTEEPAPQEVSEAKPVAEQPVEPVEPPKVEKTVQVEEPEIRTPAKQPEPEVTPKEEAPAPPPPPPVEEVRAEAAPEEAAAPQSAEPEQPEEKHIEVKAPRLDGPNILGKINLDDLNQSTRPKKGTVINKKPAVPPVRESQPQQAAKPAPQPQPVKETPKPEEQPRKEAPAPQQPRPVEAPKPQQPVASSKPAAQEDDSRPEHIEIKAPQLAGPKIIGRIELPVNDPSKSGSGAERRRDRKRIPVQKKPESNRPQQGQGQGGQQGGGNHQGGNRDRNNNQGGGPNNRPHQQGGGHNRNGQGGPGQGGNNFNRNNRDNRRPDNRHGSNTGNNPNQPQEVDSKEIQRKIQETQARLAGTNRGKKRNDYRKDKRNEMAERRAAAENSADGNIIQVTEFISVSELANLMNVSFADVISKCMALGIMVSINQRLEADIIELVAGEFGYEAKFINLEQETDIETEEEVDDAENQVPRAPIVTIMGHVDHGKTSLLDYIRNANVVAGEAGGITQHIGAYQVKTANDKRITFLDTPGHEAFTAMRARGAKVADIAVIVIAADDAIMPQTKEAISHAQAAGLPMVFALNKMDKEGANPEKIREQLAGMNILVEEWGGKYQSQEISAKKGINVDVLLEKIGLEAELLELKANPDKAASGSVIEASLDKGRGYVATILVQNGTLEQGDMIVCGQHYGRVKAMLNERGQRVTKAGPSAPVQVLGLNGAPQAGEKFRMYTDENEAKNTATHRAQILREQGIRTRKHLTLEEIGRRLALGNFKELPVIIKGDFDGSVEALSDSLQKLSTEEVAVNVVMKGVGAITESDVNLATASDAIIIGFQVRPTIQAARMADQEKIEIRTYSIIYDAINEIKSAMEGLLEPTKETRILANVEIREVYKISGVGTIAGSYVMDGKIFRNSRINLIREGKVVMTGELGSLKRFKDDVKEVNFGYECGLSIKNYSDIRVGDIIEAFEEVEVKRTL